MDDNMLNHLFNILGKIIHQMESLSLKYLPITDAGCSQIANMLSKMTSLKTLDLTACDITNQGVIDLMNALSLSNVKCLILSGNKLEPECCKVTTDLLQFSTLFDLAFTFGTFSSSMSRMASSSISLHEMYETINS